MSIWCCDITWRRVFANVKKDVTGTSNLWLTVYFFNYCLMAYKSIHKLSYSFSKNSFQWLRFNPLTSVINHFSSGRYWKIGWFLALLRVSYYCRLWPTFNSFQIASNQVMCTRGGVHFPGYRILAWMLMSVTCTNEKVLIIKVPILKMGSFQTILENWKKISFDAWAPKPGWLVTYRTWLNICWVQVGLS